MLISFKIHMMLDNVTGILCELHDKFGDNKSGLHCSSAATVL